MGCEHIAGDIAGRNLCLDFRKFGLPYAHSGLGFLDLAAARLSTLSRSRCSA